VRRLYLLIGVALLFTVVATATEPARYEAFLGFTYVRANQFNQNAGLGQAISGFSMYGGSGQFIYNFNKWISGVADFGAVNKHPTSGLLMLPIPPPSPISGRASIVAGMPFRHLVRSCLGPRTGMSARK